MSGQHIPGAGDRRRNPAADPPDGPRAVIPESGPAERSGDVTELFDLRITVESIAGRSVCGMRVGDHFEVRDSNRVTIPAGHHFCMFALASVLPLLPAKQRLLPPGDWLEQDCLVACPDPEERLVMRIERLGRIRLATPDLT